MYDQFTLPNGLRIIGERLSHSRAVSIGLWLGAGSQYESPQENGISHFIEHMLFKGTKTRSAADIAMQTDAVGAQLNAFTDKECTCCYIKVVDADVPLGMEIVSDMALHCALDPEELQKEKGVIAEEIAMNEDSPEDLVFDLVSEAEFARQPLGRTVLGPEENIRRMQKRDLAAYMTRMYRPERSVLALAGNYDPQAVRELAEKYFGAWERGSERICVPQSVRSYDVLLREKDIEQTQIVVGLPGLPRGHEKRYALSIFSNLFGGVTSSRLFRRIREEQGLVYSVYSSPTSYADCGVLDVYAGTSPENAQKVLVSLKEEMTHLKQGSVDEDEFLRSRAQLKASLILGMESVSSRMSMLGQTTLLSGEPMDIEETLRDIDKVTREDVCDVMRMSLSGACAVALLGQGAEKQDVSMLANAGGNGNA